MTATDESGVMTNTGSRPVPDPTELTDRAIAKAVTSLIQLIEGEVRAIGVRINGIDEATKLRLQTIDHIPAQINTEVSHLEVLHNEKFDSVQTQFKERDTRAERESRDNKVAVDAAFAAQKEAATKQDEANQKAIDKSEKATAETIQKLSELFTTTIDGLSDKIDDLKERVSRIEAQKVGANEQRADSTGNRVAVYTTIGLIVTLILLAIALIGLFVNLSAHGVTP